MSWMSLINTGANQSMGITTNYMNRRDQRRTDRDNRGYALQDWEKNAGLQREFAQYGQSWKIADAYRNKEQIHPLVTMGVQPISGTPQHIGGLKQGTGKLPSPNRDGGQFNISSSYQRKSEKLNLKNMDLKNQQIQQQLKQNGTASSDESPLNKTGKNYDMVNPQVPKSDLPGYGAGIGPLETFKVDKSGNILRVLDKETAEALESDLFAGFKHILKRGGEYVKNFMVGHVGSITALIKLTNRLSKERQFLLKDLKPKWRKTHTIQFNVNAGNWRLVPKGKNGPGTYDHPALNEILNRQLGGTRSNKRVKKNYNYKKRTGYKPSQQRKRGYPVGN